MDSTLPFNVCRVSTPDGLKDYVSCLPHQTAFEHGLPPEAIVGVLLQPVDDAQAITPEIFARNRVFVDFMHDVIARRAPQLEGLLAEARRQHDGWVFVIDQRTRDPEGYVPPEDIIGGFAVKNGELVRGSYQPSPRHLILSQNVFFRLGKELESCLLEELGGKC